MTSRDNCSTWYYFKRMELRGSAPPGYMDFTTCMSMCCLSISLYLSKFIIICLSVYMCDFFRTVILLVVTLHFNTEDIFNFYPLFLISDLVFRKCIYNIIGLLYFLHIFDYCWGTFYMGLHAGHFRFI